MLKNKDSSTEVKHFFLVHSENFSNHPHIKFNIFIIVVLIIFIIVKGKLN